MVTLFNAICHAIATLGLQLLVVAVPATTTCLCPHPALPLWLCCLPYPD